MTFCHMEYTSGVCIRNTLILTYGISKWYLIYDQLRGKYTSIIDGYISLLHA